MPNIEDNNAKLIFNMEELFNLIVNVWDSGHSGMYENSLSTGMIEDSIAKMNDFFSMGASSLIESDNMMTVGVDDLNINSDDHLFSSRTELESLGITGQDALELIMTYAGTLSSLQDIDTGLNNYQQELCCDFMAGIRAGLNDIDMSQVERYLTSDDYTVDNNGKSHFDAIAEGINFAHDYMDSHHDSPKFMDCFEQFKESQANSTSEIAELMDEQYGIECTMQHYKDLLSNGSDSFSSVEEYEDAIRKYFAASAENARMTDKIAFKSRESMVPYEEYPYYKHPELNPFGIYAMFHPSEIHQQPCEKPYLPNDFLDRPHKESQKLLQEACNAMCDAIGIRHIKVILTSDPEIKNAAQNSGFLPFTLIDDTLFLNKDYARASIDHFGNTDSLLVDMAHEIGHSLVMLHCGMLKQKINETLADILSTLITCMMGIDVDVARQYFLWSYDGKGNWAYKSSEGRWDASCVGRFWYETSTLEAFLDAMEDRHFRDIAYDYDTESREAVNEMVVRELDYQMNEAGGFKDNLTKCLDNVLRCLPIPRR